MEAKYTRSILDINDGSIVKLIDNEMQKLMVNLFDEGTDDKARTLGRVVFYSFLSAYRRSSISG